MNLLLELLSPSLLHQYGGMDNRCKVCLTRRSTVLQFVLLSALLWGCAQESPVSVNDIPIYSVRVDTVWFEDSVRTILHAEESYGSSEGYAFLTSVQVTESRLLVTDVGYMPHCAVLERATGRMVKRLPAPGDPTRQWQDPRIGGVLTGDDSTRILNPLR